MGPPAKLFKVYGRAYLSYVLIKWSILGSLFILLSHLDGFSWLWLMWWPVVGVPVTVSYAAHRMAARKLDLQ